MTGRAANENRVVVDGFIRGALIDSPATGGSPIPDIALPNAANLGALVVADDSHEPRFAESEVILYDRRPVSPDTLVDRIAIVQVADGRRMMKILRRGGGTRWRLEWPGTPPEDAAELLAVWRYVGSLAAR
jgi:hypothetical protein